MKRAFFIAIVLALPLGACGNFFFSDPDDVFLRIDRSEYEPGDTVRLRLVNESGEPIGYNLCMHDIQRDDGGTWTDTDYSHGPVCPLDLRTLSDGEAALYVTILNPAITPGVYRFQTTFRINDDEHEVESRSFEVPAAASARPLTAR